MFLWLMSHDDHELDGFRKELKYRPGWMPKAACRGQPADIFYPGPW